MVVVFWGFLQCGWWWPRTARDRELAWRLGSCLTPPLMRNGSVMVSLPCNLQGQTVYLLLFIYNILWWEKEEKKQKSSKKPGWLCFAAFLDSRVHFKSSSSTLLLFTFSPVWGNFFCCIVSIWIKRFYSYCLVHLVSLPFFSYCYATMNAMKLSPFSPRNLWSHW